MKSLVVKGLILCFGLLSLSMVKDSSTEKLHTLTVNITNIRNSKGRIQLQIYRDQASFQKETPWRVKYVSKENMKNKSVTYEIPWLETGVYGIAILDDEDGDKKMKYSWMMPDEGFGFGDFYLKGLSRPHFDDFKFHLNADKTVKVVVRYM